MLYYEDWVKDTWGQRSHIFRVIFVKKGIIKLSWKLGKTLTTHFQNGQRHGSEVVGSGKQCRSCSKYRWDIQIWQEAATRNPSCKAVDERVSYSVSLNFFGNI